MKTEAMYKRYQTSKAIGSIALCSTFGVLMYLPDEVDTYKDNCDLICAWSNMGELSWGYHKHKIHYTSADRAYIRKGGIRIYLDEVMRIF